MENQKNILTKADIRVTERYGMKFIILYLILVTVVFLLGFEYRESWMVSWNSFGVVYFNYQDRILIDWGAIAAISSIFILLYILPFVIKKIIELPCKFTKLTVSESSVNGVYSGFFTKKTLNMPLDKVDNLSVTNSFMDKVRSGKTLEVRTASGIIRFHFVHNAEEVVEITMRRIEELRNAKKTEQPSEYIQAGTTVSTSDKVKELLSMKESGLITEEEFLKKKEDLLSKM